MGGGAGTGAAYKQGAESRGNETSSMEETRWREEEGGRREEVKGLKDMGGGRRLGRTGEERRRWSKSA
eukprot:262327-Hanusia_phi.AAC.1